MNSRLLYIPALFFYLITVPFVSHADAFPPGSCLISQYSHLPTKSALPYIHLSPKVPVFDTIASKLLAENEIFIEYWRNDMTFVYDDFDPSVLPDLIELPLLGEDENFVIKWYKGITSGYGPRWGRIHHGLDFALTTGDTVVAAFDGVVRFADYNKSGYGNCVVIRHLNGLETLYGHLSQISVQPNQFVKAGELLGLGGSTGRSSGPHLHFETRYKDYSFDPLLIIDKESKELKTNQLVIKKKNLLKKRYSTDKSLDKQKTEEEYVPLDTVVVITDKSPLVTHSVDSSKLATSAPAQNKKDSSVVVTNKQPQTTETPKKEEKTKTTTQTKTTADKNKQGKTPKKEEKPKKKVTPAIHIVKSGESLWTISRKYGMGWEKLAKLNNLKKEAILKPGQKLKLK